MNDILKYLPVSTLLMFLPMLLIKIGNDFKNKDQNNIGADDAFGKLLIDIAPAVMAANDSNENAKRKAIQIIRDSADNYLKPSPQ